jgi:hypothetical protein
MSRFLLWSAFALMAIGSVFSVASIAAGEAKSLDGRSFVVEVTGPLGETTEDTLVFEDGRFRSVAGEDAGFGPAAYSIQFEWEDGLEFTAVAESPTGGTRRWYGMLEGALIQGTFTWEVDGQEPSDHIFEGSERVGD